MMSPGVCVLLFVLSFYEGWADPREVDVKDLITLRQPKSIQVPEPVVISSGALWVKDAASNGQRQGRSRQYTGADGIPVIEGVRSPDDPNDTRVFRNARVINNVLVPNDPIPVEPKARIMIGNNHQGQENTKILVPNYSAPIPPVYDFLSRPSRRGRIIFPSNNRRIRDPVSSQFSRSQRRYPAFYYKDFYDPDRSLRVDDEDPMMTSGSEKVVKTSHLNELPSNDTVKKSVVYAVTTLALPPVQNVKVSGPSQSKKLPTTVGRSNQTPTKSSRSFSPSSYDDSPFKPSFYLGEDVSQILQPAPAKVLVPNSKRTEKGLKFKTPHEQNLEKYFENVRSIQKAQLQSYSAHQQIPTQSPVRGPDHYYLDDNQPQASNPQQTKIPNPQSNQPLHIQKLIKYHKNLQKQKTSAQLQSNPKDFVIRQSKFQSHPGAPTFDVPIPIPANQIQNGLSHGQERQSASENVNFISTTGDGTSSYIKYDNQPYEVQGFQATNSLEDESVFNILMEPLRRASDTIQKWFEPMFEPWYVMGGRIRTRFDIPNDMTSAAEKFSDDVNNYVSRTVSGAEAAPIGAIAALALAGTGAIVFALASNSTGSLSIGRRSLTRDVLSNLMEGRSLDLDMIDRIESVTSWTDSGCAKWVFCKTMSFIPEDRYSYPYEERFNQIVDMVMPENDIEMIIKTVAKDVMNKVRDRSCDQFHCFPTDDVTAMELPALFQRYFGSTALNSIELENENS